MTARGYIANVGDAQTRPGTVNFRSFPGNDHQQPTESQLKRSIT